MIVKINSGKAGTTFIYFIKQYHEPGMQGAMVQALRAVFAGLCYKNCLIVYGVLKTHYKFIKGI